MLPLRALFALAVLGTAPAVRADPAPARVAVADSASAGGVAIVNVAVIPMDRERARAATGALLGPRIYTAGLWADDFHTIQVAPAEVAAYVHRYKAAGYDFLKIHNEDLIEDAERRKAVAESLFAAAHREGLPVVGHVPGGIDLERLLALRAYTSIEHLSGYLNDLWHLPLGRLPVAALTRVWIDSAALGRQRDRGDLARIPTVVARTKAAGVWICPTQYVYEQIAAHDDSVYATAAGSLYVQELVLESAVGGTVAARRQLISALQAAGVGLLLGVDADPFHGGYGPALSVHRELQALVRAGLTPYQALVTGTRNPAAYFGTLDSTGTIAVGKRADLVLLRANPLEDIRHTERPVGVVLHGQWLPRETLERRLTAAADAAAP